jgi:hypothetical protein
MPSTADLGTSPALRGLSRLRRNKDKDQANESAVSLDSHQSNSTNDAGEGIGLRGSVDGLMVKVKSKARRSIDARRGSDESASGNRLSTLLDRTRRGSKQKNSTSPMRNRPLSVHSGESGDNALRRNHSDVSLANGSGNSSLLTEDYSDSETYVFCTLIL